MALASVVRKGRTFQVRPGVLDSGGIVTYAFPEEFGVGATDVIGVQSQGVGETILGCEAIANLANTCGEQAGGFLEKFI
jgi:hypothetical protein